MGYRKRASSLFSKDHSASPPVLPTAPLPHSSSSPQSDPVSDSRLKALASGRQRAVSGLSSYSTQSDDDISDIQKASDVAADFDPKVIPPELAAIIALSSAHQSRCYYEGRFVFLRDLDNDGKPPANRIWQDVYGQLVGTVLSIFDSRELDGSGNRAAVKPTYINISDASFRLIDSIPSSNGSPSIKNVIALSTTFKNRFLLQFSSKSTMLLWTAALRLSLFESVALQEAYTGALLAARGSRMNGIRHLLQETKFKHQDFAVVRFGVGMPWTRCWAVVTPAGYKKRKANKTGRIDFYESQKAKQKKHKPLATVTAAKACYAVYPESSLLINQSTLFKIEGTIAVHDEASKGTPRDGFIFIMPELHHGVYGFETLIRFLIPTLDSFGLYGRPQRFNADKNDMRSIMFGLPDPPNTRYLDLADVHDVCLKRAMDESWRDDAWRAELKKIIVSKMQNGTRNVHRTLPSEPAHSTPPIPQGEMINKSLSEQMNSLSIRRPSPQKPTREPPAELLPPVNLAAGRASSDYEDALPSPVAPVSAAAAAAEMEASPGRIDDEDYSDNIIDGYDDDAAVDEPDANTLARDRAGSSASKELLRQYYVDRKNSRSPRESDCTRPSSLKSNRGTIANSRLSSSSSSSRLSSSSSSSSSSNRLLLRDTRWRVCLCTRCRSR
ncbi:hypothetical protein BZA70DRAFT_165868 [Myxozyma melibiosi]|uniref:PH domain-containing protein n=1 Tax=Myxozyma melibiosi TaxID=54550 RepID=A0ABR1F952_9ASCO